MAQLLILSILLFIIGSVFAKLPGCLIVLVTWNKALSIYAYCLKKNYLWFSLVHLKGKWYNEWEMSHLGSYQRWTGKRICRVFALNRSMIFIIFYHFYSQPLSSNVFQYFSNFFFLDKEDNWLRFLQLLLKCPVKIPESYLTDLVKKMAYRSTRISTTSRISATTPEHFLFNATEIFLLLVAGADVLLPPR